MSATGCPPGVRSSSVVKVIAGNQADTDLANVHVAHGAIRTAERQIGSVQLGNRGELRKDVGSLAELVRPRVRPEIVGSIGMELYGQSALLRSMAVASDHRSKGIAKALINELMAYAKEKRVSDMFLITNTAEQYFQRVGFKKIPREEVKEVVLQSKEFNGLCPASSAIMMKEL